MGLKKITPAEIYATQFTLREILSKTYLRQISILGTKELKIWKNKGTFVMSILKVIYLEPLFFQIAYILVPKIEICIK